MPDPLSPPTAAPVEELPDWDQIHASPDFRSLPAGDQLGVLEDWKFTVGELLKTTPGATDEDLSSLSARADEARTAIYGASETWRAVDELSDAGAFTLDDRQKEALSAPMMGSEILASMGIPDVWNAYQDRNKAKADFEGMRNQLIETVGDSKLGDLIITRDQKRAEIQQELDATTKERDQLFDEVDKSTNLEERVVLQRQISELEKKADGLAVDLGHRNTKDLQMGAVSEMDKVVQQRQEELRHIDNGIDAKTSAASTFFSTWAKGSLESAPSRFTAFLFDKIYGNGKGDNVVSMMREQAAKQQEDLLAGKVPAGMSKAFTNPSLHDSPVEQIARGTGHLMDWKTPMIFAGTPGFIAFGVGAAEQSYTDASHQTLAAGGTKHDAEVNGWTAAAWNVPTLVAYMGMGKVAQALTGELLPLTATPLARAAVTFPVNVAANMAASGTLRAMQGEDFMPKDWIEHAVPDVLFAAHSATDGYKSASKIEKLAPTMEAVAADTHPEIILKRAVADSPVFPDEARDIARGEIAAQQLGARRFLEEAGRPIPKEQQLGNTEEAAQAQQQMQELAVERAKIMRRLNDPKAAPEGGDVARLAELQTEMKGLVADALKRSGEAEPAAVRPPAEVLPPETPVPAKTAAKAKAPAPPAEPTYSVEAGSSKGKGLTVTAKIGEETVGAVEGAEMPDGTLQIFNSNIRDDLKGGGRGLEMYRHLLMEAERKGVGVVSDSAVSESAARVYESLAKRGYTVEKNPSAELHDMVGEDQKQWVTPDKSPVFKLTKAPTRAKVETTPLPEGFEALRARKAQQLDDAHADLEWAQGTGDAVEIQAAQDGLDFARKEWLTATGQEGRGNVEENVRAKLASGEYEWTPGGLAKKAAGEPAKPAGTATPPEAAKPAPAPAGKQGEAAKPAIRRGFKIPFAPLGTPDMIDFIVEQGGIKLPKRADRKQEHDDAPHLTGVYRRLATQYGKISADEMAQMLADHFFIPEAHVPTMWAEIKKSVDSRIRIREQEAARDRNEKAATKEGAKQEKAFAADAGKKGPGEKTIHVENLAEGDTVEVEGETLRVTDVSPDGDVTLEDGKKYGIQVVRDGEVIYGEYKAGEAPTEDHFELESTTDEQLKAEQAKQAQRDKLKEGAARRLQGTAGDITADIFGEGETPLFNQRRSAETPREQAERLRAELGDVDAAKQHGLTPENVKDFYNGTNETGINPEGYGQDGLTMELERRITAGAEPAPAPQPSAELPAGLTAEQHQAIEATVRATADSFTFRNEAEKDSAIANALNKVEERAARWIKETGSLEGFSAATLAKSRFTDAIRKLEQQRTANQEPAGGGEEGWTQATRDISDEGAQDPGEELANKEAARIVTSFDKYSSKGGSPEDKAAAVKAAQKLVMEGVDAGPTEIARELGWTVGSGESERPDATRVSRVLAAASADILRETNLKREDVLRIMPPGLGEMIEAVTSAVSYGSALWKYLRSPGEWNDWRSTLLRWSQRQQTSWQEIDNMIREGRKVSKSEERRAAITNWIEANGDLALLRTWEQGTTKASLRDGYRLAQSLTPEEIAYAMKVKATFDTLFQRAVAEGLIDPTKKRDNYVPHSWKLDGLFSRLMGSSSRRLSEYWRNQKARTFDTHFEGEQEGYKSETKDITRLLAAYTADLNNNIISRHFVRELTKGKASDGRPLVAPQGRIDVVEKNNGERVYFVYPTSKKSDLKGYKEPTTSHDAMTKWLWHSKDTEGNPILVRDGLVLHPEIQEHFNRIFGSNGMNDWLQGAGQSIVTRGAKGTLRMVRDAQKMTKETMLGFLSPFHAVQEGTHAIGHRVNPFFNLPRIDLTASVAQRDGAAHGLMLQPDRVSQAQFAEGLGTGQGNLVVNIMRGLRTKLGDNAVGKSFEAVADLSDNFQHWLFHQYIPALKFKTYEHMLERNRSRYADEIAADPNFDKVVKYLSATQSNAAYGHLNYADLGRHPAFQTLLSMGLLAPDFLEARAKFVGQALKGFTGRNGREQLQAIAFLALTQWTMSRILNKLSDDDWHFEAPFEVIHGNRRFRMRSVPEDLYAMIHDTRKFAYGRISPIYGKGIWQTASGLNYRSEPVDFSDTVKEIVAGVIPLTLQPLTRDLTKTGRASDVSPWEQLAGSLGLHIARYSPLPNVYKLAADWKKAQTGEDAKRVVYPESKYAALRYALEDGDQERAAREWEKLLAKEPNRPPYKVTEGFKDSMSKPLTGSKKTDAQFRDSLKGKDREMYDRAIERRRQIMRGFGAMHGEWIKAREKQKAAAPTVGSGG